MQDIYELVHAYETDFKDKPVRVVDGYDFYQAQTLKRISLYSNAQFLDGGKDELGEKVFFDITTATVRNSAKNIDLDTKDIQFRAVNGKANYFRSWLYRRKAKDWMRENKLARKLNSIPEKVSGTGSVVVKKTGGKRVFEFVDLRNLACDASARCLNDGWTSERHFYTPTDLRAMAQDCGWDMDAVNTAIADFIVNREENYVGDLNVAGKKTGNAQFICVHEFHGFVQEGLLTDKEDDKELVLANFILILPHDKNDKKGGAPKTSTDKQGLRLYRGRVTEMPYKELHYRKVDGRWLGKGIYEECFPVQEMENTRMNWLIMAMRLSQLIIFQTRDKTVLQNVLTDLQNGSIAKFGEGNGDMLSRVDTSAKDNGSNQLLANEVREILRGLTNSYEVTTGDTLPSGTPFSLGALMNQNANKLFDFIREDYGLFLEEIFNDWVLPELEKELSIEGVLEIVDKEELEYVREHFVNWKVWDSIKRTMLSGMKPTMEQISVVGQFVRQQLEKQESLAIEIPKDFLKFEKRVVCMVTDEQESPAMMQSLTTILQTVAQNPAVIDMPAFDRILDMVGMAKVDVMPRASPVAPTPPQPVPA